MEYFVQSSGNPKPVKALESREQLIGYTIKEMDGMTPVQFSLPTTAFNNYHFDLQPKTVLWLICTYSMENNSEHHSRMGKHVKATLYY